MRTLRIPLSAAAAGFGLLLSFTSTTIQAADLIVSANVQSSCVVNTLTDTDFLNITPGGPAVNTTGTIEWACTTGTPADIEIDNGNNFAALTRNMAGPGAPIAYSLYQDSGFLIPWGLFATGDAFNILSGAGMTVFTPVAVYAEVPAAAYVDATPGAYTDTVVVTILF